MREHAAPNATAARMRPAVPLRARRRRQGQRGVTLVEALVALTILAVGLIASLGVQATLRLNADVARQRSEATRLAQAVIAGWRAITSDARTPAPLGATPTWADIVTRGDETVAGQNATYVVRSEAVEPAGNERKDVRVAVRWLDRQGQPQAVELVSSIARQSLRSTALLINPVPTIGALGASGRTGSIPLAARDLGNGTSAFAPPGSLARPADNVWILDNVTGLVTSLCTVPTASDTPQIPVDMAAWTGCRRFVGQVISGRVLFATAALQPTPQQALAPTSGALNLVMRLALSTAQPEPPVCRDNAPRSSLAASGRTAIDYYCLVAANAPSYTWEGYLTVVPRAFTDLARPAWVVATTDPDFTAADGAAAPAAAPAMSSLDPDEPAPRNAAPTHRLCRYTSASTSAQAVPNEQHPWFYRTAYADPVARTGPQPMPSLTQQNFLVILAPYRCPADAAVDVSAGRFVSANTLFHAPWP